MKLIITAFLILSASLLEAQHLNLSQSNEGENLCWILIKPDLIGLAANDGWLTKKEIKKEDYLRLTSIFQDEMKRRISELPIEEESEPGAPNCNLHIFAGSTHTAHSWRGKISELNIVIEEVRKLVAEEDLKRFLEIVETEPVSIVNDEAAPHRD